jgi:DNA/RNA endonuclease G (NUC1)
MGIRRRNGVILLLVGAVLACIAAGVALEHAYRSERSMPADQAILSSSKGNLIKYGLPEPHELAGPYHVLRNQGYVSGYDAGIQDPRWVETRFFGVTNPRSVARPKQFSPDDRIEPRYRVDTHFLTDTGYDRGHMAPNWGVSICYGRNAQIETFLLTNVVPQSPALNRGLWETLEKIISNDYARRFGQVWVMRIAGKLVSWDLWSLSVVFTSTKRSMSF